MEFYFAANVVTDTSKQRAIYSIKHNWCTGLQSLAVPNSRTMKSLRELVKMMTKHFCPPPSEIVQRFKFNTRVSKPGESVDTYTLNHMRYRSTVILVRFWSCCCIIKLCVVSMMHKIRSTFWLRRTNCTYAKARKLF